MILRLLWRFFVLQNCNYLLKQLFRQRVCLLLNNSNDVIHEIFEKLDKNPIKPSKFGKFWKFCRCRSQFVPFFLSKLHFFFTKASRTMNGVLIEHFQQCKLPIRSKNRQKLHKNVKKQNFLNLW